MGDAVGTGNTRPGGVDDEVAGLRNRLGLYSGALDKMRQGLCVFDSSQRLLLFNRQYAEMYNLDPNALLIGMTLRDVIDLRYEAGTGPEMSREDYATWRDHIAVSDRVVDTVVELRNGSVHEIHHEPTPGGGWVATFDDITERRRAEARIEHLAHHDILTGLPNRLLFRERLERAYARTDRGEKVGVLCLDLDRFKAVNDGLGHAIGDALLCSVAGRIRHSLREGDTACRLGGDEFAIVQVGVKRLGDPIRLARRLLTLISRPHDLEGHRINVGVSVGIAVAPEHGADPEETVRNADVALYRAKQDGRRSLCVFEPGWTGMSTDHESLRQSIRAAA